MQIDFCRAGRSWEQRAFGSGIMMVFLFMATALWSRAVRRAVAAAREPTLIPLKTRKVVACTDLPAQNARAPRGMAGRIGGGRHGTALNNSTLALYHSTTPRSTQGKPTHGRRQRV